jgi:hypothetical protein
MIPLVAVMKVTLMLGSNNSKWVALETVYLHLL